MFGSRPVFAIFWISVQMRGCNNEDLLVFDSVDNNVGEPTSSTSPRLFAQWLPGFWQILDPFNRRLNFVAKFRTRSSALRFVKPDSFPQLRTCDFKKSNGHRSSNSLKTTSAGIAFI